MGWITDILKEVPLSAVLREKLATADTEIDALKTENTNLRELVKQQDGEIDRLKKEVASLQKPKTVPDVAGGSRPRIRGRMGF
jgi:predicted RNase H-like nuclease (RuvC/YqgF family)